MWNNSSIIGSYMSSAKTSSELETVETHESELAMAHIKDDKTLQETAWKKKLRNKQMQCSVSVRTEENPMRSKALTPVLVLGSRDRRSSNVT